MQTRRASDVQKGKACEMRYDSYVTKEEKKSLNQIVHSGDSAGQFANTYNPYRDLSNSYDPKAQIVLDSVKSRKK